MYFPYGETELAYLRRRDRRLGAVIDRVGYVDRAVDADLFSSVVHHIIEVESGRTEQECRLLCFDPNNLESLCRECHAEIHRARGYHTMAAHQQRARERLKQWVSRLRAPDASG